MSTVIYVVLILMVAAGVGAGIWLFVRRIRRWRARPIKAETLPRKPVVFGRSRFRIHHNMPLIPRKRDLYRRLFSENPGTPVKEQVEVVPLVVGKTMLKQKMIRIFAGHKDSHPDYFDVRMAYRLRDSAQLDSFDIQNAVHGEGILEVVLHELLVDDDDAVFVQHHVVWALADLVGGVILDLEHDKLFNRKLFGARIGDPTPS